MWALANSTRQRYGALVRGNIVHGSGEPLTETALPNQAG